MDIWSFVHLITGMGLVVLFGHPLVVFSAMVLWEPLEVLVLSPALERWKGIRFGREALPNVMSDIVVDGVSVLAGLGLSTVLPFGTPLVPLAGLPL